MEQEKKEITNFLRTLADRLDQHKPPIAEIKKIAIKRIEVVRAGKPRDFEARITVRHAAAKTLKTAAGDVEICLEHLNVCEWVPCQSGA